MAAERNSVADAGRIERQANAWSPLAPSAKPGSQARGSRRRADSALIEGYESMRGDVVRALRGRLLRSGLDFPKLDLEAFYNAAWVTLHEALGGGELIERPVAYLITVAYCRGIDEARKTMPSRRAGDDQLEQIGVSQDLETTLDDRDSIASFQEAMSEVLTDAEYAVFVLCVFAGYTRPQVADMLGVTHKRMERIMDDARVKLRPLARSIRSGEWCARYSPRLRALASGMLDERNKRYADTLAHLARCAACRAELQEARGVAA